ncbi:hypothetical protein RHGRI_026394 [Rhododendron griersonianum]|uniref:Uncharacterized protein n=1 Tax=Rhododendron griersonianum TaxID=479676 RepID=A0AAV6IYU9_9ERIC|nr:hypothetical protein RHGRI_026394 [Rhododendron griersonianum]
MILLSSHAARGYPQILHISPLLCPCKPDDEKVPGKRNSNLPFIIGFPRRIRSKKSVGSSISHWNSLPRLIVRACVIPTDSGNPNFNVEIANSTRRVAKRFVLNRLNDELERVELPQESVNVGMGSNFTSFQEDPIVDKLRTQLGVIHPIPSPPINRNIVGLFVFFFFVGVAFDKLWTSRKRNISGDEGRRGTWPQVPTSFSLFLEKDLQRKESVEWVNMVLGKLWKVYRSGIENWIIGLLQPVIDNLKKPDYVQRVEIKQFSLGDEPLSVRNVERRTSRRVNDLQYQIGIRYTGGARMLLLLSLNFSIIPIAVPVGVRDFDIDGELWVKLRLIPSEPWVGVVSWAFVSLPKIKFELSPFRLFNLMAAEAFVDLFPLIVVVICLQFLRRSGHPKGDMSSLAHTRASDQPVASSLAWIRVVKMARTSIPESSIPVLSMFLKKLLTEDLPRLFVRPKKIVLDFQKGKAVGPVPNDFNSGEMRDENKDLVGESPLFQKGKAVGPVTYDVKSGEMQEGNKDFVGELSVTLVDARKLSFIFFGKTDPYVILSLGDQVIRSKKNSQTTVIGPPGEPIWNQDFHMLVANPRKQKLQIQVKDALGFTDLTIGTGEVDLVSLEDTVPTDRVVVLRGGWGLFRKGSSGEILLRLTYKAYVEDEEDERTEAESLDTDDSDDELFDLDESDGPYDRPVRDVSNGLDKESFMDVLAALLVSEEFQGIVASETGNTKSANDAKSTPSTRSSSRSVNGSALVWLAVVTIILVLTAINMGGSSFFNP